MPGPNSAMLELGEWSVVMEKKSITIYDNQEDTLSHPCQKVKQLYVSKY
jgi:hypothetical protein